MSDIPHGSTETARLFLALWPTPSASEALAAWHSQWTWPDAAIPVPAQRMHLTLHFLGDVRRSRLGELVQALSTVPFIPFELGLGRAALWPRNDLAVVVPDVMPPRLLQLHEALRPALLGQGLPTEERAFRPHLTLARRARGAVPPEQVLQARWRVREYTLVDSRPEMGGNYRVLQRYS